MTIYVDNAFIPFRGMKMCHLITDNDNIEELHQFAERLGLKRSWFQHKNPRFPHYDVGMGKRAQALRLGAKECSSKELIGYLKNKNGTP